MVRKKAIYIPLLAAFFSLLACVSPFLSSCSQGKGNIMLLDEANPVTVVGDAVDSCRVKKQVIYVVYDGEADRYAVTDSVGFAVAYIAHDFFSKKGVAGDSLEKEKAASGKQGVESDAGNPVPLEWAFVGRMSDSADIAARYEKLRGEAPDERMPSLKLVPVLDSEKEVTAYDVYYYCA